METEVQNQLKTIPMPNLPSVVVTSGSDGSELENPKVNQIERKIPITFQATYKTNLPSVVVFSGTSNKKKTRKPNNIKTQKALTDFLDTDFKLTNCSSYLWCWEQKGTFKEMKKL